MANWAHSKEEEFFSQTIFIKHPNDSNPQTARRSLEHSLQEPSSQGSISELRSFMSESSSEGLRMPIRPALALLFNTGRRMLPGE